MKFWEKIAAISLFATAFAIWAMIFMDGDRTRIREVDTAMAVTGGNPVYGYHSILTYGCGACHTIPGVPGATGKVGPSLVEFRSRAMIAGVLANNDKNLIEWIRHPRKVDPRTAMPDLGVSENEAKDIAAYLYALRTRF
jgi:cytochrome c2